MKHEKYEICWEWKQTQKREKQKQERKQKIPDNVV